MIWWIPVNENFKEINVQEQLQREDSVYSFYKKLIQLRHGSLLIKYGTYHLLLAEDTELFVYERILGKQRMLVACNFTEKEKTMETYDELRIFFNQKHIKKILGNYNRDDCKLSKYLKPWAGAAWVLEMEV